MAKKILTVQECCDNFEVTRTTFNRWKQRPDFPDPHKKTGNKIYYNTDKIKQFLDDNGLSGDSNIAQDTQIAKLREIEARATSAELKLGIELQELCLTSAIEKMVADDYGKIKSHFRSIPDSLSGELENKSKEYIANKLASTIDGILNELSNPKYFATISADQRAKDAEASQ